MNEQDQDATRPQPPDDQIPVLEDVIVPGDEPPQQVTETQHTGPRSPASPELQSIVQEALTSVLSEATPIIAARVAERVLTKLGQQMSDPDSASEQRKPVDP